MKKFSIVAVCLALILALTACASPAGLLLKDATLKQTDLQSYESNASIKVDIKTAAYTDNFSLDMYAKQIDPLNSISKVYITDKLLALAGLSSASKDLALEFIMKDGDIVISTSQDEVGIKLANLAEMMEEGMAERTEAERQAILDWYESLQEKAKELVVSYLKEYAFKLNQIENLGQKTLTLANGQQVEAEQIKITLSLAEALDMLTYSLQHVLDDADFQKSFAAFFAEAELIGEGKNPADISATELAAKQEKIQTELNQGLQMAVSELKKVDIIDRDFLAELGSFEIDTYIGVADKQIYQQDMRITLNYTEKVDTLAQGSEDTMPLPLTVGDSISFEMTQQIWNHNQTLEAISLPAKIVTVQELEKMESIEDFKAIAGEDSFMAQIAEQFMAFAGDWDMDDFAYVELYVNENRAITVDGEEDVQIYNKNGRVLAPLDFVTEAMGADETWDVPVEMIDGLAYVQVRDLANAAGWTILWNEEDQSVVILK